MSEPDDEIPVSETDPLEVDRDEDEERVRKLGDYRATNVPLPAAEVKERERGWIPRTTKNIHEIIPLEDDKPLP